MTRYQAGPYRDDDPFALLRGMGVAAALEVIVGGIALALVLFVLLPWAVVILGTAVGS